MSRSYKHTPGFTDYSKYRRKAFKRLANKKVRRYKDIMDGAFYKKIADSWNICDFKSLAFDKYELDRMNSIYKNKKYKIWIK